VNRHLQPWQIRADDFPADGFTSDQLEFLLSYAVLAPSTHNSQPWLFRINAMDAELVADRRRALRVVDPYDRELTVSCGAALFNVRVAMEYLGHQYQVELLPDPADPNLLARVHLGLSGETSGDDVLLFHAITQRHTNRQPFRPEPLPTEVLAEIEQSAGREGVGCVVITAEADRAAVAELVMAADRLQWSDARFREEMARWVRTQPAVAADGLTTHDLGIKDWLSFAGPLWIRTFDRGGGHAAHDRDIAMHSPALAVLWTAEETPRAWLQAGQALQSVLLHARTEEVWASFLNQPIEVPDLRARLAELAGISGHPQILLRLGYGEPAAASPRLSLRERLIRHPGGHA